MHIAITDDEARAIREALDYKAEDLAYRLKQGLDFSEPEDIERVQKTIVILNDLFMRLGTPQPTYDADGICPNCGVAATDRERLLDHDDWDMEEDPDAPDDGKMLIAGQLYDRATGELADPQ